MASPAGDDGGNTQNEKVAFRFCHECSNMLYPREDKMTNQLIFQCRNCSWSTEVSATCIYRNELSGNVSETAGVIQDVASDPTVGDIVPDFCTLCGEEILCPTCNKPTDGGQYLEVDDMRPDASDADVNMEKEEREQAHTN